jgi:hypothetical protein
MEVNKTRVPSKLYDILKVKGALILFVQCVTGCSICTVVVCMYVIVVKLCGMHPIQLIEDSQFQNGRYLYHSY